MYDVHGNKPRKLISEFQNLRQTLEEYHVELLIATIPPASIRKYIEFNIVGRKL